MLTVDKNELLKIQDDVYANPQKYESMFTAVEPYDWGQMHLWAAGRQERDHRLADYQFWHSMINDGTNSVENWPYYREYLNYKEWFDQVEDRALDTLKFAISKLLSDFDKEHTVFDGEKKTKRAQIEGLLSLI